ncbi:cation diffusion facilitator family transporter [Paenibacillus mesophilus]|uniref:cation diffusion facilitator family transporter n=1 Tax=Paenibacillus mesophilus TaxID=2582849 RepID=UPI00110F112F|nr:cation diffusion facilitator family transporter [Paenibacillus mesophilus]TMV50171.1 cation diffusion facilitator family transporter [Paenibacillus mesophilus]
MESDSKQSLFSMLKRGNASSGAAALGNVCIAIIKGIAAFITGSGTMFASTMHSIADAVNQGFVYAGSILSERKPTKRFPTGFGRLINIFCMVAVIVVSIMAYETIKEGLHLIRHPAESHGFWLNFIVLTVSLLIDGIILFKAMKEIVRETRAKAKGLAVVKAAFLHVKRAAPPTRLVFYEDLVATSGALLAIITVVATAIAGVSIMDGICALLIGLLMVGVAFRVGYDNMVGLIGVAAPIEVEERIAAIIFADPDVTDINKMRIVQEGRFYHVEAYIELRTGLTLAVADDIKFRVRDKLLVDSDIADVTLGIIEDNGVINWSSSPRN